MFILLTKFVHWKHQLLQLSPRQLRSHTRWHSSTTSNLPCHTIYPHIWYRGWTFRSNHQSRCLHGFRSHVQCSHHCTVQKPAISISDLFGIADACLPMTWLFWLLLRLVQSRLDYCNSLFFSTCQVSISISSSASKILLPSLLSMIGTHPSNRFLLNCTGSLFKPALNLKFALSHISYFLKTNLRTSDHS